MSKELIYFKKLLQENVLHYEHLEKENGDLEPYEKGFRDSTMFYHNILHCISNLKAFNGGENVA